MRCRSLTVLICTAIALVLTGCTRDLVKAPPAGRVDLVPIEDYPQITATQNLHEWLVFSPATVKPAGTDQPMSVSVPFRSTYDKTGLNLQFRFLFFDESRRPLRRNPGYQFIHVEPRIQDYLEANSLETDAVDWRLQIRAAR